MQQQLTAAQARIGELEAQVAGPKAAPAFVKAKRHKPAAERQPRKKRAAEHNTSRKRMVPTRIERFMRVCEIERYGQALTNSYSAPTPRLDV
jgi:hypothetical protein